MPIECLCDELEQRDNSRGTDASKRVGGTGEEEVEEAEPDGVALAV